MNLSKTIFKNITHQQVILLTLLMIALIELIRTAWISDDAAITLRTVLNFIHGYGPRFNIDERVQAYTHPLWFLLISGLSLLTRNVFATTFILSISFSLCVLWFLMTRVANSLAGGVLATTILIFSKAYVDFSTSGLENPLSHLLIIFIFLMGMKNSKNALFFFLCGLLYLSRPDLILLVLPFIATVICRRPRELAKCILIGAFPVILWTLFSIYYYGFPFPNTAYAKLGTGIPLIERIYQGLNYLSDSFVRDTLTSVAIFSGILIGFQSSAEEKAIAFGICLYLIFIVSIGGDFMSGRFLTAPLLLAVVLIARHPVARWQLIFIGLMLINASVTLLSGKEYSNNKFAFNGIADERGYYFQQYGLLNFDENLFHLSWIPAQKNTAVICGGLGFESIRSGPEKHWIDECGLADPLLARLPTKYKSNWRIGHFHRRLPTNYFVSIEKKANLLSDSKTKNYYESIRQITRGNLNDLSRFHTILLVNLGLINKPDWEMYRYDSQ